MADRQLRRQWPGWLIAAAVLAVIVCGTVAVACHHQPRPRQGPPMNSTFRLLLAAMPDIAAACEPIGDPHLRDRAFDVLVAAARDGGDGLYSGGMAPETSYGGYAPAYDPSVTRVDNGTVRT